MHKGQILFLLRFYALLDVNSLINSNSFLLARYPNTTKDIRITVHSNSFRITLEILEHYLKNFLNYHIYTINRITSVLYNTPVNQSLGVETSTGKLILREDR